MPLTEGHSKKTIAKNTGEIMRSYKRKGKIGNTTPKSTRHAQKIAAAIAYDKARES